MYDIFKYWPMNKLKKRLKTGLCFAQRPDYWLLPHLQGSLLSCLGIKPVTSCSRGVITCPFQHIMTIQCMRWDIGCEAYYDNMLDFRQLHKKRHHKMSKWPVNHDVCCSPFSQGWPLWQALTANKKGAVRRNKSAQTSCTCLYSEATFVPVVWPSSPLKDSVRHTASLMYCDDTTLCVSATSAPAAVKATTAMMTPPTTAVMTPPTTAVMTPPTTAVMAPTTTAVVAPTTTAVMTPTTTTAMMAPTTTAVMATATENDSI